MSVQLSSLLCVFVYAIFVSSCLYFVIIQSVSIFLVLVTYLPVMSSQELPLLSESVKTEAFTIGGSSLVNIWEHGLRLQMREKAEDTNAPKPGTVIAPTSMKMVNLVPQDVAHPLYHDGPMYTSLRNQFILDCLVVEKVNPDAPEMETESGLTKKTMNARELVFKRQDDTITVNGLKVMEQKLLSDGTMLYVLDGIPFTYASDVREAFNKLMEEKRAAGTGSQCFMGSCRTPQM